MPPFSPLAITGPTASGKTAVAMALAQRYPVEIISVDSALVYRGMDIGTAKPSAQELAQVPHHLINIREPEQPYSAAEFAQDARGLIAEISARGKLPLLVGGTMLYFKALLEGLSDLPAADAAVRAQLQERAACEGWPALHQELARVDPLTAARLNPNDAQRISRALEIFQLTGQPLSTLTRQRTPSAVPLNLHMISLEPTERSWLHERIAHRFDAMLTAGFLDEVANLRARPGWSADLPAMRCVGYRQAIEVLEGNAPLESLRDRGIFATRQLAKRQLTWLRSMPERRVVACDGVGVMEQVLEVVAPGRV